MNPEPRPAPKTTRFQLSIPQRYFKACQTVIPKDRCRFILEGFNLRHDERGLYITSCDGRSLVSCRIRDQMPDVEDFNITLKNYVHAAGKTGDVDMHIALDEQRVYFFGGLEPSFKFIEGNYPNWDAVLLTNNSPSNASFDPEMISSLTRAASLVKRKGSAATTVHMNGDNACVVTVSGIPEFLAVLMPMRGDSNTDLNDQIERFKKGKMP